MYSHSTLFFFVLIISTGLDIKAFSCFIFRFLRVFSAFFSLWWIFRYLLFPFDVPVRVRFKQSDGKRNTQCRCTVCLALVEKAFRGNKYFSIICPETKFTSCLSESGPFFASYWEFSYMRFENVAFARFVLCVTLRIADWNPLTYRKVGVTLPVFFADSSGRLINCSTQDQCVINWIMKDYVLGPLFFHN